MDELDLTRWQGPIRPPDETSRAAARARQDRLTKPTGALGRLEDLSVWLSGVAGACPPPPIRRAALTIFAGDHGVARTARTSAYPPEVTAQMVATFVAGGAGATVLARSRGVRVRVVDVSVDADWSVLGLAVPDDVTSDRIRRGSGSIDREDAMTRDQTLRAIALGARIADELVDAGADLLIGGDMGIGNTTPAAVLVGLLTDAGPAEVVGRGTGIDDAAWMRKTAAVRDAMRRGRRLADDPVALLAAVTGPDLAAMTGYLVQAARRGVPVLLDGIVSCACALLAERIAPGARAWWQAAHRSTEPAADRALKDLGLDPILDLGLRLGEGSGALVALPVVTAAGDLLREMATFESAGVSDRDVGQPGRAEAADPTRPSGTGGGDPPGSRIGREHAGPSAAPAGDPPHGPIDREPTGPSTVTSGDPPRAPIDREPAGPSTAPEGDPPRVPIDRERTRQSPAPCGDPTGGLIDRAPARPSTAPAGDPPRAPTDREPAGPSTAPEGDPPRGPTDREHTGPSAAPVGDPPCSPIDRERTGPSAVTSGDPTRGSAAPQPTGQLGALAGGRIGSRAPTGGSGDAGAVA